jgi:hypothetical protein
MHLAESSSTLFCLWTGLSLPVALHPASRRRSYLQLRTGQCSRPEGTFTLLLVRTFRRTCPRHFVPGYDRTVPPGLGTKPLRGNKSSQTFLNLAPFSPGLSPSL